MAGSRKQLGTLTAPIPAVEVRRRPLSNFDHPETRDHPQTAAWILTLSDGRIVRANTYSGNLGKKFSPQFVTPETPKQLEKWYKGYEKVDVAICPFATPETPAAESTPVETPVTQESAPVETPVMETPVTEPTGDALAAELIGSDTPADPQ